jgi:hypothetical protein
MRAQPLPDCLGHRRRPSPSVGESGPAPRAGAGTRDQRRRGGVTAATGMGRPPPRTPPPATSPWTTCACSSRPHTAPAGDRPRARGGRRRAVPRRRRRRHRARLLARRPPSSRPRSSRSTRPPQASRCARRSGAAPGVEPPPHVGAAMERTGTTRQGRPVRGRRETGERSRFRHQPARPQHLLPDAVGAGSCAVVRWEPCQEVAPGGR